MIFYFYATCVAVVFLDFGSSTPLPPVAPFSTCPPTYILQNGICYPQNLVQLPCSTCQTAVTPTPTPPCQAPCQNGVAQPPCSTCQTQPCQTTVAPCQNGVTQPPCSTCLTAVSPTQTPPCQTPCQNAVTQPPCATCQTQPCQTTVAPCQNGVTQPPCSTCQTVVSCQTPCQNGVTQPCPSCPLTTTTSTTSSPPTTTTSTTTTPTTTTTQPRPDPIIRCPTGTILVNGYCHLIYCGSGIYRDGKCIVTICPEGTVWTGSMCEAPIPQEHVTFNITNTIYTNVNRTNDNHQMNYTNNITIHITEIPEHEPITESPTPTPYPEPLTATTKSPTNCCIIVTPIACAWDGYRHNCKSRRYRQCGSICTSKYIYLTPPKVQVIPPPPIPTCMDNNCGYDTTPFYPDCSTCDNSMEERCMTYCRRSTCQMRQCQAVDMRGYCDNYRGSIGCRKMEGCNQDWCDDYSDYQ